MAKYIKKIQSNAITGVYSQDQLRVMNHYKDQPTNGPTLYAFENPETKITRTAFVDREDIFGYDDVTDFSWRFGYNEGHPCVFITFYAIHENLKKGKHFLCLETNTNTKKGGRQNSMFDRNQTINCFCNRRDSFKYITWMPVDEIELYKEICLYISGGHSSSTSRSTCVTPGPWRVMCYNNSYREIPDDWKIKLNIRPTFRHFGGNEVTLYKNYKALAEYQYVEYFYKDEKKIF